jgi:hypothetical protein
MIEHPRITNARNYFKGSTNKLYKKEYNNKEDFLKMIKESFRGIATNILVKWVAELE